MLISIAAKVNPKAKRWLKGRQHQQIPHFSDPVIWMHCSSLGEFEQGRPVLEAIRKQYTHYKIVLTFFSPSGYEIRKNYPLADAVVYLPLDGLKNAQHFIKTINPVLVIWVKYEYWYYYLSILKQKRVPVILISAIFRPNQPFFKEYGWLWKKMLSCFTHVFVQNSQSKVLLQSIGFQNVSVSGDTRFDRVLDILNNPISPENICAFIASHKVIVAGSTWEDDEALLIHFTKVHPEIKLIIAPHEITKQNLSAVKKKFNKAVFYSELQKTGYNSNVLIIDNVGMLSHLYRYATIAYVGGGFNQSGIHNTLEAAVFGKPVIFGPVYEKFKEAKDLIEAGGAFSVNTALELETLFLRLLTEEHICLSAGESAEKYVATNGGATEKITAYIQANRLLTR